MELFYGTVRSVKINRFLRVKLDRLPGQAHFSMGKLCYVIPSGEGPVFVHDTPRLLPRPEAGSEVVCLVDQTGDGPRVQAYAYRSNYDNALQRSAPMYRLSTIIQNGKGPEVKLTWVGTDLSDPALFARCHLMILDGKDVVDRRLERLTTSGWKPQRS